MSECKAVFGQVKEIPNAAWSHAAMKKPESYDVNVPPLPPLTLFSNLNPSFTVLIIIFTHIIKS